MKKLIILFIFIFSSPAFATTYYVSKTGSDSANGTSVDTPWQTINKVNTSSFQPDDQILFKRGDTWREQLTVPSSGTSGHPITFGAYGIGEKPIISGADNITSWSQATSIPTDSFTNTTNSSGSINLRYNSSGQKIAIKFTAGSSYLLQSVSLKLYKVGSPSGNLQVSLFDDSAGNVGTNNLGDSSTVAASTLATAWGTSYNFTFSGMPSITASTVYWLVITGTFSVSTSNYVNVSMNNAVSTGVSRWNGSAWTVTATQTGYFVAYATVQSDLWQATASVSPNLLFENGTLVNPKSTIGALSAQGDWVYFGSLYMYSASDPAQYYSSGGVEASQRDYCITSAKDYVSIDSIKSYRGNGLANIFIANNGSAVTSPIISNCEIDHGKQTGIYFYGTVNGIIRNNYIHHIWNGIDYANSGTGQGISLYGSSGLNNQIYNNYLDSNFRGIFIYGASGAQNNLGTQIYYNIVKDSYVNGIDQFQTDAHTNPTLVYNNTVIHNPRSGAGWGSGHGIDVQDTNSLGMICKNNIVYSGYTGTNVNVELMTFPDSATITTDSNLLWIESGSTANYGKINSNNYSTFNDYVNALAASSILGKGTHSINTDPLFLSPSTGDFHLLPGSPCINAGVNVGLTQDYDGILYNSMYPYIGAYDPIPHNKPTVLNNAGIGF